MTRYEELASKLENIDENKKPFVLATLKDFCKWEEIENDLSKTALFRVKEFKGKMIAEELPSFKMLNTATARKTDAVKTIAKLIEGEQGEESPLMQALSNFSKKYNTDIETR